MSMRKVITRTITATTIESARVIFEMGTPVAKENPAITVNGIIAEDKALKEVRKAYGENTQVTNIVVVDDIYEISVDDFIKYATKVVPQDGENVQE